MDPYIYNKHTDTSVRIERTTYIRLELLGEDVEHECEVRGRQIQERLEQDLKR